MRRQTATTMGLVVLLLIDIGLVSLAFRNPFRSAPARIVTPTPTVSSSVATATFSTIPTVARPVDTGSAVTLVPIDGSKAWRFTPGSCRDGGATLALTTNGGAKWTTVDSPFAMVSRLQSSDPDKLLVLGAQADCRLATQRSTDKGLTWVPGGAAQMWTRDPLQPADVTNSSGRAATPCGRSGSVVSLVALSAGAALALCADGKAVETADAGTTWVEIARGLAPLAIDAQVVGGRLAATVAGVADGCQGLAVTSISGSTATRVGCADVGIALGPQLRGRISLASVGDNWWLAIGADTFTSTNAGKTWTRS